MGKVLVSVLFSSTDPTLATVFWWEKLRPPRAKPTIPSAMRMTPIHKNPVFTWFFLYFERPSSGELAVA